MEESSSMKECLMQVVPEGSFQTRIVQEVRNKLIVRLTDENKECKTCWLLLINSKDTTQRYFTAELERENDKVRFDLSNVPEFLFEKSINWLCYLAWNIEDDIFCKRLRKKGEPIYIKGEKKLKGSNMLLWQEDSQRYMEPVAELKKEEQIEYLVPFFNEEKNTLAMKCMGIAEYEGISTEILWHEDKEKREEEEEEQFRYSVVIAAYKAEEYLEETVDSILKQDIGFKEHIQLILVNDGSPDRTGTICDEYAKKYPKNITVIHKQNGGVASARNEGKKYATGTYINFCDSDDKFSENAFSTVDNFLKMHKNEVDVVTMPLLFFEAQSGPHWQNYKFEKGERVIDLWQEYDASDMFCNASFFKREATEEILFDPTLPCGEDIKFVAQVLLKKMALGVVVDCNYWYRRRNTNDSLINVSREKKSWYFEYFDNMVTELMKYAKKIYGFVPYFIQNTIMMDLQWRFRMKELPEGVLSEKERKKYIQKLKKALESIEDKIIIEQRKLPVDYQVQAMELKYQQPVQQRYVRNDIKIYSGNTHIRNTSDMLTMIDNIEINQQMLEISGKVILVGLPDTENIQIYIAVKNTYAQCEVQCEEYDDSNWLGKFRKIVSYRGRLPIADEIIGRKIQICVAYQGYLIKRKKYGYDEQCVLDGQEKTYQKNGIIVSGDRRGIQLDYECKEIAAE